MTAKQTTVFYTGPYFGGLCLAALIGFVSAGLWDVRGRVGLFWDRHAVLVVLLSVGVIFNSVVTLFHLVHLGYTPLYRFRDSWFGDPAYSIVLVLSILQALALVVAFGIWIMLPIVEKVFS